MTKPIFQINIILLSVLLTLIITSMNYVNILIKAGLSTKEAAVYLANYELGESTASRISQKSEIKRATTYMELENLIKKGLVSQSRKKNLKYYTAESPKMILSIIEENKKDLEQNLKNMISLGSAVDKKPTVRYFEGVEGIKEVYRDTLEKTDKEILSWFSGSTALGSETFYDEFYIPERQRKNIWFKAILPNSTEFLPYIKKDREQLRVSKTVDEKEYNMDNEIMLYDKHKTAILNYGDKISLIIDSQKIHDSFKQIFEVMWEMIPQEKK